MATKYLIPEIGVIISVTCLFLSLLMPLSVSHINHDTNSAAKPAMNKVSFTTYNACADTAGKPCVKLFQTNCDASASGAKGDICKASSLARQPTVSNAKVIFTASPGKEVDTAKKIKSSVAVGQLLFIVLAIVCQLGAVVVHLIGTTSKIAGVTLDHVLYLAAAIFCGTALIVFFAAFYPDTNLAWIDCQTDGCTGPHEYLNATADGNSDVKRTTEKNSLGIGAYALIVATVVSTLLVAAVRKFQ